MMNLNDNSGVFECEYDIILKRFYKFNIIKYFWICFFLKFMWLKKNLLLDW